MKTARVFADGGSRGNPGPAASAAVVVDAKGEVLAEFSEYLGRATNNVAEWRALIGGLETALELGIERVEVRLDSELVVKQLSGEYRVKHPDLVPLYAAARKLLVRFTEREIRHVPRAQNKLADALVNQCLDGALADRDASIAETEATS